MKFYSDRLRKLWILTSSDHIFTSEMSFLLHLHDAVTAFVTLLKLNCPSKYFLVHLCLRVRTCLDDESAVTLYHYT